MLVIRTKHTSLWLGSERTTILTMPGKKKKKLSRMLEMEEVGIPKYAVFVGNMRLQHDGTD